MKQFIFLIGLLLIVSCKSQKSGSAHAAEAHGVLAETAARIVNDFLVQELQKKRYKNYGDYDKAVIGQATAQSKPLSDYALNYEYKNSWRQSVKEWVLDSIQIQTLQSTLKHEPRFYWRAEHFNAVPVHILDSAALHKSIKTGNYLKKTLIIHMSKPLMIDENNALLSYDIGNGDLGNFGITHFTVLMRKSGKKWVAHSYYEDMVFY